MSLASNPARGVDIDCLCLSPAPEPELLAEALDSALLAEAYQPLSGINDVLLDTIMEWHLPGERCVALAQPLERWQLVYDSHFASAALADALGNALGDTTILQFSLQEGTDLVLRLLRGPRVLYEYSNVPSSFNWGRCLGKTEAVRLARADVRALAEHFALPEAELEKIFHALKGCDAGEKVSLAPKVQELAALLGLPRLYRFFQGWLRSDLDWEEDGISAVKAYRKSD